MNQYNEDAYDNFNTKALESCHNCGRTFLPDSLKIHLRSCDKKYAKLREQGASDGNEMSESPSRKPGIG